MLGLGIAVVAVFSSALQQVMCGVMQRKHLVSSHQLLSNTAHIQVCSLAAAAAADVMTAAEAVRPKAAALLCRAPCFQLPTCIAGCGTVATGPTGVDRQHEPVSSWYATVLFT